MQSDEYEQAWARRSFCSLQWGWKWRRRHWHRLLSRVCWKLSIIWTFFRWGVRMLVKKLKIVIRLKIFIRFAFQIKYNSVLQQTNIQATPYKHKHLFVVMICSVWVAVDAVVFNLSILYICHTLPSKTSFRHEEDQDWPLLWYMCISKIMEQSRNDWISTVRKFLHVNSHIFFRYALFIY